MLQARISPLVIALALAFCGCAHAELYFDPAMISDEPGAVADLSRFSTSGAQLPGAYPVDIYLNGENTGSRTLRFDAAEKASPTDIRDQTGLMACLTKQTLADMGVTIASFAELAAVPDGQCISPGKYIPQAWMAFDFQKMRLDISIPQAAIQHRPRGWIPPEQWDEGVNAALLSWQFSGSENDGRYGDSRSQYLNLTSGANVGAWRLRDNSSWSNNESNYRHQQRWQHLNTYLQRAIIPWRSELTLGDGTTDNEVFDSLSFRGVQLASDDAMYPDTLRGFAPVIRGTANSSAEVSIWQSGNEIYRTFVPAGAFVIDDLYPQTYSGDLEVRIKEANGATRLFTVPYSSVPLLQRQGRLRYGITAGRYRNTSESYDDPSFVQGTLLWGLPHNLTAYGGAQLAQHYRSLLLGAGVNMGAWGALSADITQANSTLADGSHHQGQSVRFLYSRSLDITGTTFQLAGYRYSTQGFYTLEETALKEISGWTEDTQGAVDVAGRPVRQNWLNYYNLESNRRERLQATISQRVADYGSLYLNASRQTYWGNAPATTSMQLGFSSSVGRVSYNVAYGYSRYSGQPQADKTLWLSLSLPLDGLFAGEGGKRANSLWANYSASRDSDGNLSQQAGLSGTALEGKNLNWSVLQGYGDRDGGSGDVALGYRGTYGNTAAGYGYSRNSQQLRYSASGSAVWHSGGITFGQPLSTTNVLVAAPGAGGVPVENSIGVRTDWRGYTVVPYASEYRQNRVALDVNQLDNHTDIDSNVSSVVPTRGALVRADFKAHSGARALIALTHNGKPLPFGAMVSAGENNSSLVGDGGQVYLSGLALKGELKAQWGAGADQHCSAVYSLPQKALQTPLTETQAVCR